MEWTRPKYSRREVNEAGEFLRRFIRDFSGSPEEMDHTLKVVGNFRASHAFPLNTFQISLRKRAHVLNVRNIVAQRLKRLSSIWAKLNRFERMKLGDIQDIGGCRAIVRTLDDVQRLVESYKSSSIRHKLSHEDDYIQYPKDDGYRSRHLVYRYISDRSEIYNGLKIEMQIRTPLQHAWATTVETVDAFTKQALKSSRGEPEWKRFFQLMGTEMAFREGTPPVPNTPLDIEELHRELRHCAGELQILSSLAGFTDALIVTRRASAEGRKAAYFLLSLDNIKERLSVTGYKHAELDKAAKAYAREEEHIRAQKGTDAVLVSVDSIRNLQRAYPNYFADTRMFARILREAIK
jgi:hypothetical protein